MGTEAYYINDKNTAFLMDTGKGDYYRRVMRRIAIRECAGADMQSSVLIYTVKVSSDAMMRFREVTREEFLQTLKKVFDGLLSLSIPELDVCMQFTEGGV